MTHFGAKGEKKPKSNTGICEKRLSIKALELQPKILQFYVVKRKL